MSTDEAQLGDSQAKPVDSCPRPRNRTTSKTFTGCWTCRRRKVKCDLQRPKCQQCERNNLKCEGYSIKLCWDGRCSSDAKRRLAGWVEFPAHMMYEYYEDIDAELNELHAKIPKENQTIVAGPFSLFTASPRKTGSQSKDFDSNSRVKKQSRTSRLPKYDTAEMAERSTLKLMDQSQPVLSEGPAQTPGSAISGNLQTQQAQQASLGPEPLDDAFLEVGMNPFSHDMFAELGSFMDDLQTLFPPSYIEPVDNEPAEPEDILFEPGRQEVIPWAPPDEPLLVKGCSAALTAQARYLLSHYENHVTPIMTMIVHLKNPWKTIYLPRAYSAIGDIVGRGHTSSERYTLLNSLLSVSAYHIRNKFPLSSAPYQHYADLALRLEQIARGWLARCLHFEQPARYKDLLVAVLTMFTLDLVKGGNSVTVPLNAAQKLVTLRCRRRPKLSRKAMILHRICVMLTLLSKATVLDVEEEEQSEDNEWIYRTFDDIVLPRNAAPEIERLGRLESRQKPLSYMNDATQLEEYFNQYSTFGDLSVATPSSQNPTPGASNLTSTAADLRTSTTNGNGGSANVMNGGAATVNNETWTQIPAEYEAVSTQLIHGMPDSLVHLFKQVMDVSRRALLERLRLNGLSPEIAASCTRVEAALASWKSRFKETRPTELLIPQVNESVSYHALAIHDALVIYHYRLAKDVNRALLQPNVERIIGYLEAITAINAASMGPQPVAVPFFFPGFIGGCEVLPENTKLRRRYDRWYHEMKSTGVSSYAAATAVVNEVNRLRSGGLPSSWWDVMQSINAYPILI